MTRFRMPALLLTLLIAARVSAVEHVGFRVIRAVDDSRTFAGRARPVQVSLWYPAPSSKARTLTYRDYLSDLGTEGTHSTADVAASRRGVEEFREYAQQIGVSDGAIQALLEQRCNAVRGAQIRRGKYPLVLIAVGRDESPVLHVALAEALAAAGYVVASVPTMGDQRRQMGFDLASVETSTRDLEYAMLVAFSKANIDRKRIAAVGYSFGSGPALLLAMKNQGVAAFVSVDGSIAFSDRQALFRSSPLFDTSRACMPLLHLNVLGEERNDLSTIEQLACSTRIVVSLAAANHLDFTIFGAAAKTVSGFRHGARGTTAETQAHANTAMTELVVSFIQRVFAGQDVASMADLVASPNRVRILPPKFKKRSGS